MLGRKRVQVRKRRASGALTRQFFVGFLFFLVFIAIAGAVWYGSRLESLTIVKVSVVGGDTVSHDDIKILVEQELDGNYYSVVPKRFSWTYPEEQIVTEIESVPKVKEARLTRPDSKTVEVHFVEYNPVALWCQNQGSFEGCIFLDDTGYAFSPAPPLQGNAMPRYFNQETPTEGQNPFTYEFMRDTLSFSKVVRHDLNFVTYAIEKVGVDEAIFELYGGGQIKITLRQPLEVTLENLRVLLGASEFTHIEPGNFEYIDLRFGDKVFVNEVKGEEDEEINAASSTLETAL